jgi:hypothetical protein
MRASVIALFLGGLMLPASVVLSGSARGEGGFETTPIGKVVTAKGAVTVEHTQAVVLQAAVAAIGEAKVGDFVYRGDVVQTEANSAVGIAFTDGTAFNLSSNARMVLNEFVYDPKGKSNSTLISLSKGTFTFVAGQVAKTGDMRIDTPVATMGIRGTTPHVEISDDGTVSFSTLIEEPKPGGPQRRASNEQKGGTAAKQRQAMGATPRAPSPVKQAGQEALNFKLSICRGC